MYQAYKETWQYIDEKSCIQLVKNFFSFWTLKQSDNATKVKQAICWRAVPQATDAHAILSIFGRKEAFNGKLS